MTSGTLLNSEALQFFFFSVPDESSSDENAHDVGDEETTSQESSSNKDIGHDVNSYQLQNRSPFYATGERNLIACYDVYSSFQTRGKDCFQFAFFHLLNLFHHKGKNIISHPL